LIHFYKRYSIKMSVENLHLFEGLLVDCNMDWSLRVEPGFLLVSGDKIVARGPLGEVPSILETWALRQDQVTRLSEAQFILPGLIDTHIHAPQFPNAGLALDLTLLDWLEKYTFPTESRLGDVSLARDVYKRCVRTTLGSGTTTACYFATIHRESTEELAQICIKEGQRGFIGKVCMDRNSPDNYCENTAESLASTRTLVKTLLDMKSDLVHPVVTPRFVPSCTRHLMSSLGDLAMEHNLHIQTHLGENLRECDWVRKLEPDCETYTEVYLKSRLLGQKTILAHCCHLSDIEVKTIKQSGAGVSHCPNSNFSLKSGCCNVQRLRSAGVKVGLGTDCSGGYSPSILNAMRQAVMASNTFTFSQPDYQPIHFSDALYLATRGGASLLDMDRQLGSLDTGKLADILLVDMKGKAETLPFGHESPTDLVHKFVFLGDDRNIAQVWVGGRKVKDLL